ncbi:MAG: flagellar basal body L-ring protein FlgH [bacterium]
MKNLSTKTRIAALTVVLFVAQTGFAQQYKYFRHPSLYTDVKARGIGDVITILIVEATNGSRQSDVTSSDKSALSASGSVTGNLTKFLPLFGASSDFSKSYDGSEATAQKDLLTGKITAVVTQFTPSGNLVLQGKRRLEVNGETHILELKGIVRPKDIDSNNIVFSYNLANVEIAYKKAGLMNRLGKPGWVARWSTWLLALGLGGAAYLGVSAAN